MQMEYQREIFQEWYGLVLHCMLAEQTMSILRAGWGVRALNAHIPCQARRIRRIKCDTDIKDQMIETGGVAAVFWEKAVERVRDEDRQVREKRKLKKSK